MRGSRARKVSAESEPVNPSAEKPAEGSGEILTSTSFASLEGMLERARQRTNDVVKELPSLTAIVTTTKPGEFALIQKALDDGLAYIEGEKDFLNKLVARDRLPKPQAQLIRERGKELNQSAQVVGDLKERCDGYVGCLRDGPHHIPFLNKSQTEELMRAFGAAREAFWRKMYFLPMVHRVAIERLEVVVGGKEAFAALHTPTVGSPEYEDFKKRVEPALRHVEATLSEAGSRRLTKAQKEKVSAILREVPLDPDEVNQLFSEAVEKVRRFSDLETELKVTYFTMAAASKSGDARYQEWSGLSRDLGCSGALSALTLSAELTALQEPYLRIKQYLAMANYRYVYKTVLKQERFKGWAEDLSQDGMIGMMRSIEKFDVNRGFYLLTYATPWIFQTTQRQWERIAHVVSVPNHPQRLLARLRDEVAVGDRRSNRELAKLLKVDEQDIATLRPLIGGIASLDASVGAGADQTFLQNLEAKPTEPTDGTLDASFRTEKIHEALAELSPRDREILIKRFGLDGSPPLTLKEVGELIGITRERVRQLEAIALQRLRSTSVAGVLKDLSEEPN